MWGTVLWVGLVVTVVGFISDALLYTFVFNKGMEHLVAISMDEAKKQMGRIMGTQFLITVVYGLAFTWLYATVKGALPEGPVGGMQLGLMVWLVGILPVQSASANFFGKVRALSTANIVAALVKFLISGVLVSSLI